MRVLYDYQVFMQQEFGGVSRYHMELYKIFKDMPDIDADIVLKYARNRYLNDFISYKDISYAFSMKNENLTRFYAFLNQVFVGQVINKNKYDIIHPTWYSPYIFRKGKNEKLVITVYDMIQELFWRDFDGKTIVRKKEAIKRADAIIAISENTKKDILKLYPDTDESKISVVYLGTSALNCSANTNMEMDIPQKYFLFVGRRGDYKNGMFAAKALANLMKNENIYLFYAGGGAFTSEETEIFKELAIENRVIQKNVSDSELVYLYKNAICFIYPSSYEGFGLPILEAFGCNCPVVCTNSSSIPEVGGDAALYFDNDDYNGCANAVEKILADCDLKNDLILKGLKRTDLFTWSNAANGVKNVYKSVLDIK